MKITRSILFVFGVLGAVATLEGCGGSQINPSAPTQSVAESKVGANPDHRRSWMASDAAPQDLLYVSDLATYDVNVYSYPGGKMKGRLTGFGGPATTMRATFSSTASHRTTRSHSPNFQTAARR